MRDIDEIRRSNIRRLEIELGSPTIAAKTIGMTLAQYLNLREGAKDSKTGKQRGMRKETAWKIEDGAGKPRGWLDLDREADDETLTPSEVAVAFEHGSEGKRNAITLLAKLPNEEAEAILPLIRSILSKYE